MDMASYFRWMDGVLHEKVIELFNRIICTYHNSVVDYSASSGTGGCGNYSEYVTFPDDSGDYHDDPGTVGVFYISVFTVDYHIVPAGN